MTDVPQTSTMLGRPRPVPNMTAGIVAGSAVIALALPVFFVAGWPIKGWVLGAVLWAGSLVLGVLLLRMRLGLGHLTSSGAAAFGLMFRGIAVMIVAIAVAASDPAVGLSAALLYAVAYSLELGISIVSYFNGEAK
jgi:hypothetical protein